MNVVVSQSAAIFEISETPVFEALLVLRHALLVLDLLLDVRDGVGRLDVERDDLVIFHPRVYEDLHELTESWTGFGGKEEFARRISKCFVSVREEKASNFTDEIGF